MRARLVSVKPDDPVQEAIRKMLDRGVGAVAVCDGPRLAGIFTERDVLRLAGSGAPFAGLRVGDVMTTDLVTVAPDDDIEAVAHLMGEHRIRHVPVVQGGNVLGIVGIRDIVAVLAEKLWREHDPAARETVHELLSRPAP
jgi:CBS domain-containing protein